MFLCRLNLISSYGLLRRGIVTCVQEVENIAFKSLDRNALGYYSSGADAEITVRSNVKAFDNYTFYPHMLRHDPNLETSKLFIKNDGEKNEYKPDMTPNVASFEKIFPKLNGLPATPIGVAPTAMQCMAHPIGEVGTYEACKKTSTVFILSTLSTTSMEEVARSSVGNKFRWFQLYVYKDRDLTSSMVERAEKSGYSAIVLTVDAPVFGLRRSDVRNNFSLPSHLTLANFQFKTNSPNNDENHKPVSDGYGTSGISEYVNSQFDPTLSWADLKWLTSITKLPILVKGILRSDDALRSFEYGASGVIVSNHGGRQLDGVPPTIDVLYSVSCALRKAVKETKADDTLPLFMDGGIRRGSDVLKALLFGAHMVFVGRPVLWGLTYNGSDGVEEIINLLNNELRTSMALNGIYSLKSLNPDECLDIIRPRPLKVY